MGGGRIIERKKHTYKHSVPRFFVLEHDTMCTLTTVRCPPTSTFFFSSRRRHTRLVSDWSSDVCSSDLHHPRRWSSPLTAATGLMTPTRISAGGVFLWP